MKFKILYLMMLIFLSCGKNDSGPQFITLKVAMPEREFDRATPAVLNDINCVGALVGFQGGISNNGTCTLSNNGTTTQFAIGTVGGLVSWAPATEPAAFIEVPNVPVNNPFTIVLLGFDKGGATSCLPLGPGFDPIASGFSRPFVIGQRDNVIVDLGGGQIDIGASFDVNRFIADCTDSGFENDNTFDPNVVPGLAHWYDMSDTDNVYQVNNCTSRAFADGQSVACVMDKKNAKPLRQSTAADQATFRTNSQNNLTGIEFDGMSDFLQPDGGQVQSAAEATTFIVFKALTAAVKTMWGHSTGGNDIYKMGLTAAINIDSDAGGAGSATGSINFAASEAKLMTMRVSQAGDTLELFLNGVSDGAGPMISSDYTAQDIFLGAFNTGGGGGGFFHGIVYEVLYYKQVLSDANRQLIENYLIQKWGL